MIDEGEAEMALEELANELAMSNERVVTCMVDSRLYGPDAHVVEVSLSRKTKRSAEFEATIHYKASFPMFNNEYIEMEVSGILEKVKRVVSVKEYQMSCYSVDPYDGMEH